MAQRANIPQPSPTGWVRNADSAMAQRANIPQPSQTGWVRNADSFMAQRANIPQPSQTGWVRNGHESAACRAAIDVGVDLHAHVSRTVGARDWDGRKPRVLPWAEE